MPFKRIVISVDHMGKPHRPFDRGAVYGNLIEADLCLEYANIAARSLTALGIETFLRTSDYYGQRAAFANQINADLYLSCHLNSFRSLPRVHYSLVEISQYAGQITRSFAQHIAGVFEDKLPVDESKVWEIKKGGRGWTCIDRVRAPALLFEPLFINCMGSLVTKDMVLVGEAIAEAVEGFNQL